MAGRDNGSHEFHRNQDASQSTRRQLELVKRITEYQVAQAYQVVMDLELQLTDDQHTMLVTAVMHSLATNHLASCQQAAPKAPGAGSI
jgi:hypothetical protein